MPFSVTCFEISLVEFGFIVLISAIHIPSCLPASIPQSPKTTSFTASASFTTTITNSDFSATFFGESSNFFGQGMARSKIGMPAGTQPASSAVGAAAGRAHPRERSLLPRCLCLQRPIGKISANLGRFEKFGCIGTDRCK